MPFRKTFFVQNFSWIIAICFWLITPTTLAANHFVRSGATGANNGTDWSNAFTSLPATLVRGDTYYIAGGTYSGRTFNTPVSGTLLITIKGATIADHGTSFGWINSYSVESTQARWTSEVAFNTSYWVFDGVAGPTLSKDISLYGFRFTTCAGRCRLIEIYNTTQVTTDVTISHVAAIAPTSSTLGAAQQDVETFFIATNDETKSVHRVTFSHCYLDGWSNAMWATSMRLNLDDWIVEYNVILNGFSSATNHGEDLNNNGGYLNNLTVRYNWFEGRQSGTASIVCLNAPCGPFYIYGNIFKKMAGGDGIITGGWFPISGEIYNNTFIEVDNGYNNGLWIGHDVKAKVYNNLIYNSIAQIGGNFTGTNDYNAYFNTTKTPVETHGQIGSGSPFINEPANDLRLIRATNTGLILLSPYNRDLANNLRGADGVWDRGAYEFVNNTNQTPTLSAPRNLRIQ